MKTIDRKGTENLEISAASSEPVVAATTTLNALGLKNILVPIDFSEQSQKALRYAARFAEQFGSTIILLHVFEVLTYPAELGYMPVELQVDWDAARKNTNERLEALAKEELKPTIQTKVLVRSGTPFNEIAAAARELNVDLIILSTHGYSGLKHLLMGSTAERVVRHAPCPVLVVRERERDFISTQNPAEDSISSAA